MGAMQKRAVRLSIAVLLLAAGIAAAFLAIDAERQVQALEDERAALERVIDRLAPAVAGITATQQAYVEHGQRDEASFARVSTLLDQITTDAAGLRPSSRTAEGPAHLEEFWTALSALKSADSDARDKLATGDSLAAADLLFSATRPEVARLDAGWRGFRDAELEGYRTARAALHETAWTTIGAVALLWVAGLLALVRTPVRPAEDPAPPQALPVPETHVEAMAEPPPAVPAVDLPATAALCGTIARLTETTSLPEILDRAAAILDARGIIVWMGAGEELFAATAVGYDTAIVSRLRPINRHTDNATATAWRTGETRIVASDMISLGAIVAPMAGAAGCIGVLAAEVRNGRESDPATQAVAAIIASQLAAVLSAWPAASSADTAPELAAPMPGAGDESDRQAAAS